MRRMTQLYSDSKDECQCSRCSRRFEHPLSLVSQCSSVSLTHTCQGQNHCHRSFPNARIQTMRMYPTSLALLLLLFHFCVHHGTLPCDAFTTTTTVYTLTTRTKASRSHHTMPSPRSLNIFPSSESLSSSSSSSPHQLCNYMSRSTTTTTTTPTTTTKSTKKNKAVAVTRGKSGSPMITSIEDYTKVILQSNPYHDSKEKTENDDSDNDRPILLFWTAPWCGPCRLSIPIVKAIRQEYNHLLSSYEICTDDVGDELPDLVGITSVPTIQLYYHGTLYDTIIGCVSQQVLSTSINKMLEDVQKIKIQQQLLRSKQQQQPPPQQQNHIITAQNPLVVITTTTMASKQHQYNPQQQPF